MSPNPAALEAAQLIDRLERLARSAEGDPALNPAQWEALRYLARANRFSRNPAALADYLGSTRGTVSQTLIALEEKSFVTRSPGIRDRRSVAVALTEHGHEALQRDPLLRLAADLASGSGDDLERLVAALRATLRTSLARNGGRAFGACYTCRYFRSLAPGTGTAPHHCALLDEPLSAADSQMICAEQTAA